MQTAKNLGLHFLGIGSGTNAMLLRDRGARVLPDLVDLRLALRAMTEFA